VPNAVNFSLVICIGAQKAGTTWLYEQFIQNPCIALPKLKEVNYFNDKYSSYTEQVLCNYEHGIEWYISQLAHSEGKIAIDFSPNYLWDKNAALRMSKDVPQAKIVVILRDPVERAYSQFIHSRKNFYTGKTFREAITRHPDIIERGFYGKQLAVYLSLFPKNQIGVFFYSDLKRDPCAFLCSVYKFLDIKEYVPENIYKRVNEAKEPKLELITKLVTKIYKLKNLPGFRLFWRNTTLHLIGNWVLKKVRQLNLGAVKASEGLTESALVLVGVYESDKTQLEQAIGEKVPW
jgi:hypothetical protein